MQTEAPAIFDLSKEPTPRLEMYGVGKQPTNLMIPAADARSCAAW
jgi:hypothetical protein